MQLHVDLHTHSTASDGQYSPAEVVRRAKASGIELLALTDHDTLDGLDEAVQTGREIGLRVLRGVELGVKEDRNLHILAYNIMSGDSPLSVLCRTLQAGRQERKHRILDFLREKGLPLTLAEVEAFAGGAVVARPHFAQAMTQRGYVQSPQEAFARYLDTDEYSRIARQKPSAEVCLQIIHTSAAHAALAHPYQLGYDNDRLETLIRQLKARGLDAIECYYPRHTPAQTAFYLSLAAKYGLAPTAGSDFHGERLKPDIFLTPWPLETGWLLNNTGPQA